MHYQHRTPEGFLFIFNFLLAMWTLYSATKDVFDASRDECLYMHEFMYEIRMGTTQSEKRIRGFSLCFVMRTNKGGPVDVGPIGTMRKRNRD